MWDFLDIYFLRQILKNITLGSILKFYIYYDKPLPKMISISDRKNILTPDQDGNPDGSWVSHSHGCTKYATTHGATLSDRKPEKSWVIPMHQATEQILKQKQEGKAETHSHHKFHPAQHHTTGRDTHLLASPWGAKGLECISWTPVFRLLPIE